MARRGLAVVTIIGHLGKEPSLRYAPSGTAVTTFTVAVNRPARSAEGEQQEAVEWFTATAFGKVAETAAEFLKKGSLVCLDGRLQTRRWEDKAGQSHVVLEVVARDLLMLGEPRSVASPPTAGGTMVATPAGPPELPEDDREAIPF